MTPLRSLAALSTCVLLSCGAGWACFHTAMGAVVTSQLRLDPADTTQQDENLLLLGLDSRLDEEGHPLPQEMYEALHAGDDSAGGYNANVLIVVHIPKSGAITAVSVPRDDYVDVPGCPEGQCQAKVKQAYGLAYAQALDNIPATADVDTATREQSARDAGRRAEVDTVQDVLGVHLDHFVEVTLAGFFQVAALTQPITVCLNADTSDDYSGANFRQGVQNLSAAQAVAFVRQRRDDNDGSFTDLDRTRRQQAFLVSLLGAVRRGHGMTDPVNLARLLDIAHRDMAVDAGFDLGEFVTQAAHLVERPISLYTLPITDFGQDAQGSDINLVDVATLRRLVADHFGSADTTDTADTAHAAAGTTPVAGPDVVAATGPGPSAPAPTQLSRMDATSATACVK